MPPKTHGGVKKRPWNRPSKSMKPKKCADPLIEESDVSFTELVTGITNIQVIPDPWLQPIGSFIDTHLSHLDSHSSSLNMLPENHPLHDHTNKLFDDFRKLSNAVDSLKFSPTIEKNGLVNIQRWLDVVSDTVSEMETIQAMP